MNLLLDTNVLSEATKPQPDRNVMLWLDELDEDRTFISVISLAEIQRGVSLLDAGRRRNALEDWLAYDLPQRFGHRVLPIDEQVALAWGTLMGHARKSGRGLSSMDGLIAATAIAHDLMIATRNTKDFGGLDLKLVNPWDN